MNRDRDNQVGEVIEILGRTGSRGGITQVKLTMVNGERTLIRNIKGPVQVGDRIMLIESEREARRVR